MTDDARWLSASQWLDVNAPEVQSLARQLTAGTADPREQVRRCFEWVRDEVQHSGDHGRGPVTCRASDVLRHGTGYCYAKAHLLVALLRAAGRPAALCYQRLTIDETGPPMCLHGLAAVHLNEHGWIRVDPRGNRPGVDARFAPPDEPLAFPLRIPGECDVPGLHAEPMAQVVHALTQWTTWDQVLANLPDIEMPATTCCIGWARAADLPRLPAIEMDAGQRFAEHGRADVASAPPLAVDELEQARREARVFVAFARGQLAGFAMVSEVDGEGHLDEVSVLRAHAGRGIGSQLLEHAASWARLQGYAGLTLSTFRDVPFNAPFYERRGFAPIPTAQLSSGLRAKQAAEARRGLHPADRVCMRKSWPA